jgi:hypothetical protein
LENIMRFAPETQLLRLVPALSLAAVALSSSLTAHAHFRLLNPPTWVQEDAQGNPQKGGPCGEAGTATNMVTTYTAGETIMVSWQETIGHSGHFRISLTEGAARDALIDPAVVTANGDGVSGNSISATTVPNGTGVVLLDNLFPRDTVASAQAEPFTQAVTLPDRTCEKCTLQVIQFMSQHGPGYFYHHCADIKIVAKDNAPAAGTGGSSSIAAGGSSSTGAGGSSAGGTSAAGSSSTSSAGSDDGGEEDDGGCSIVNAAPSPGRSSAAAVALVGLAMTLWRRRSAR